MFKEIGNLASMMKAAQQMGGKLQSLQEELRSRRVTGTAGGGMVEIEANGLGEVLKVKLDPQLFEQGEREMIEDLLPAAFNQVREKVSRMRGEAMQSMTAGLNLPGLDEMLSQITGGET